MIFNELLYKLYCNRMRSFHEKSMFTKVILLEEFQNKFKKILFQEFEISKLTNKKDFFLLELTQIWSNENKINIKMNNNLFLN